MESNENKEKTKLIVVLGMHRSGTSAVTRGLQVMGVDLGEKLLAPVEDINAKGFWEDADLVDLNEKILDAIHSSWYALSQIDPVDLASLHKQNYFLRAVELIREKTHGRAVFGMKDPRVAKLLPFWNEVFIYCNSDVRFVLALRNPLSVVRSLSKRDGLHAEHSYFMWLDHVLTSVKSSEGHVRAVVDYDLLMQKPEHELTRMARELGLHIDPADLLCYQNEFLNQDLRHTVFSLRDLELDMHCPPIVYDVYSSLLDVASGRIAISDQEIQSKIVGWMKELSRLKTAFVLVDRLVEQWVTEKKARCEAQQKNTELELALSQAAEVERRVTELALSQAAEVQLKFTELELVRSLSHASEIQRKASEADRQVTECNSSGSSRITKPWGFAGSLALRSKAAFRALLSSSDLDSHK